VCYPQALGQQQLQLVTEPRAPMAEVRALVRKGMLEELLPSEVLELRVIDSALAHRFIGLAVDAFEHGGISRSSQSQSSLSASCTSSCHMLMIWLSRAPKRSLAPSRPPTAVPTPPQVPLEPSQQFATCGIG
jgi:hypothetical protein